jgi:hypothetical protein
LYIYTLKHRAARIILNAKYDIPSLQLFKKLGWLSIQNRLEYHKSVLTVCKYVRKRHINPSLDEIFETILLIC